MEQYREQTNRIKYKLALAKKAEGSLKVFGASSHRYVIGRPATAEAVNRFEQRYGIVLPDCIKAFYLQVGNGGESSRGAAAGPFYGIYPLGYDADELVDGVVVQLQNFAAG